MVKVKNMPELFPEEIKQHFLKRGAIYYADLDPVVGCEQGGLRPVLIVQNNIGNRFSPTVIVAAITSRRQCRNKLPTHIELSCPKHGLEKDSIVLLEQIRTIDKKRLKHKISDLDDGTMNYVDAVLKISLGLDLEREV